jgi:UDP-N-acetylmuramate dehydrogenase
MGRGLYAALRAAIPPERLLADEPLSKHCSFGIGGPAEVFAAPSSREELSAAIEACRAEGAAFVVLGRGTNILAPDEGVRGAVIATYPHMNGCRAADGFLRAEAGASLADAADTAMKAALGGLEFAAGIPGTVGGAVYMNAGAYEREIAGVCASVEALTRDGALVTYTNEEMAFAHRDSAARHNGAVIVSASFKLYEREPVAILTEIAELNRRRRKKQPLDCKSAGSVFKRPPGDYAGRLVEACGLKGFSVGGARVSEKHAGFIINAGGASADDVKGLIAHIQKTVYNEHDIMLETEIVFL